MKPSRHIATILLPEIFLHSDEYGKAAACSQEQRVTTETTEHGAEVSEVRAQQGIGLPFRHFWREPLARQQLVPISDTRMMLRSMQPLVQMADEAVPANESDVLWRHATFEEYVTLTQVLPKCRMVQWFFHNITKGIAFRLHSLFRYSLIMRKRCREASYSGQLQSDKGGCHADCQGRVGAHRC